VTAVRPYAVDVRSGVETNDRKDRAKMRAFVRAVRESDAEA
jgi:phosphoribosylanthranilate isomerase